MIPGNLRELKLYIISRVADDIVEEAEKFYSASHAKKILYCMREFMLHIPSALKILGGGYLYIYHMEQVVTTKCSLKCRDCSNLMQYYKSPYHILVGKNIEAVRKLTAIADEISTYTILGGEPMLYKELSALLGEVINNEKIHKIRLITNGTILPKDEGLLRFLQNKKVYVYISNYGEKSRMLPQILELFRKLGIRHYVSGEAVTWVDLGGGSEKYR